MKVFRLSCIMVWLLISASVNAKIAHLLPTPKKVEAVQTMSPVALTGRLHCAALPSACVCAAFQHILGQTLTTQKATVSLSIKVGDTIAEAHDYPLYGYANEAYRLTIGNRAITIEAETEVGVIRAVQTLAQLAEGWKGRAKLEACSITDWPAFRLRGWMHDVGRSYLGMEELKREIRLLGHFKVNTFHWHLTENEAWRFEVKRYPQLTSAAAMTRFPGQYYTQEQCRELVALASQYGIVVIPEIDMPGHSRAFERAMGHGMQTDEGLTELKHILDELCEVFDKAPYIHIGADEQQITYPGFLPAITSYLHAKGRRVVVWNPIRGVAIKDTGADMTQLWSTAGRVVAGMPNIDCRYNYVNHFDIFADLVGIYKSNIYYARQGSPDVAGEITAVWNDRYLEREEDIVRQNNLYANVLAATERAWKGGGERYIEEGGTVLPDSGSEYEEFADWERRFLFHKSHALSEASIPYVRQSDVRWQVTCGTDTMVVRGAAVYLRHTWGDVVPGLIPHPRMGTTAWASTYIYSPVEQTAGALIEFQNYGRSERDKAPENGQWDRKGSRLWLNDEEIPGPTWDNAGRTITNDVPLRNENLTARPPVAVRLHKGWNHLLAELPYAPADGVRLNKWMFTFVLTDPEGRDALDGIVYSPTLNNNKQ